MKTDWHVKRKMLLMTALFVSMLVQSKDHTVVVRGNTGTTTGSTEVTSHEGEDSDTLTVTPGTGITTITVTVRDLYGSLISNDVLSAAGDYLEFSTPQAPGGCIVTLRDDNGVVYMEYDD
jgi:hypothetical protein